MSAQPRAGDSMTPERRVFTRVLSALPVTLVLRSGEELPGHTVDISLGGLLIECTEGGVEDGDDCVVIIDLTETQHICLGAQVVRAFGDKVAVEMNAIDEESALHLYHVVCHHVPDMEAVEDEVRRWLRMDRAS